MYFDYSNQGSTNNGSASQSSSQAYAIRDDLVQAHRKIWEMLAQPGCWWRGEDRIAIATETRHAANCSLCAQRKSALSPNQIKGEHQSVTNLPSSTIDAIHRIVNDASRLTQTWLQDSYTKGMTEGKYIELLGVLVALVSIDGFHRAMGLALEPLPDPVAGEPTGYRPPGLQDLGAWVEMIPAEGLGANEADLYLGAERTGAVIAAMSVVPDSVRMLQVLGGAHYMEPSQVANPRANGGRAITRPQIELLAGRVSAINDCFY